MSKKKKKKKKGKKKTPRNSFALVAKLRKAGPMKDRRTPRAGAKNKKSEILSDLE